MGYPQTYITGVVNESCLIPRHCSVHDIVFIDSEHVSPETLGEGGGNGKGEGGWGSSEDRQ